MHFQFNSENLISGSREIALRVEQNVRARLDRIGSRLTRVEVYVSDVNGPRGGGNYKKCVIEARPIGQPPVSATDQAASIEAAAAGAADKVLAVFDRLVGKRTSRKGH